jgi:hypothetical protein
VNPERVAGADEPANLGQQRLALLKKSGLKQHAGDFDRDLMVEEEPHSSGLIWRATKESI